ncbi:hypothetical protein ACFYUY_01455 [Kitasatospora sp. NPDC004745]|uniref:DUF7739 domain-containing protein n=1 Tax=Kitasatospora sp. NPDC004745 TaxID=3364019 RepID=UPI00367B3424
MAWSWDHNQCGGTRSYSAHAALGEHLSRIAARRDWEAISVLFGRAGGDAFDVPPERARRMGEAFKALAPFADGQWRRACLELGAAAAEAGRTGSVWHWS